MSNAYVIEVGDLAAGIVVADGQGVRFFSSECTFDGLEGNYYGSARAAERAAKALIERRQRR
jgi:hypothetical protein